MSPRALAFDLAEVSRALALLHPAGHTFEVRVPNARLVRYNGRPDPRPNTVFGFFDDASKAVLAIKEALSDAEFEGAYLTLNPVNPALLARAANRLTTAGKKGTSAGDHDISRRLWMLLDFDPVRPSGVSSTNEEKEAAHSLSQLVYKFLRDRGWPKSVAADSGNGYHLLICFDLPGNDDGLVKSVLEALAFRFNTDTVKIDRTVFNPARIVKLYGTPARKGDSTDARPHRISKILSVPKAPGLVTREMLEKLVAELAPPAAPTAAAPRASGVSFDLEAWIAQYLPSAREPESWNGGTRWIIDPCPFNEEHRGTSAAVLRTSEGKKAFKCQHAGCAGLGWKELREKYEVPRPNRTESVAYEDPWTEPVPFDAPVSLPSFPVEALPPELGDFVSEVAESVQVPADLPGSLVLAVAAATVARRCEVAVGETHSEPLNLFVAAAMESGTRKTEVFRRVTEPLEEIEEELVCEAAPAIERAAARRETEDAKLKCLKAHAANEKKPDEARRLSEEIERLTCELTVVPKSPQLIVGDETPEHLATVLADQVGRIALFDGDASLFDVLAGRYSGAPNFEIYLKSHAGDTIRVGRQGRGPDHVKRPALTVAVCVQPSVIRALASTSGFRGRGLLGRFLYTLPESLVGSRRYHNRPVRVSAVHAYSAAIVAMHKLPEFGSDTPHRLVLRGAALEEWRSFADRIESEQADGKRFSTVRDWASKAAGAAARLAGVLHALRYRNGTPAPWAQEIDAETAAAAVALMDYFAEHALAAYSLMEADERIGLAKKLLRWIERHLFDETVFPLGPSGLRSFSLRDCHRHHRSAGRPSDLLPGLEVLEARGFIRRVPEPEKRPAHRPPSQRFEVSPYVSEVPEVPEPSGAGGAG